MRAPEAAGCRRVARTLALVTVWLAVGCAPARELGSEKPYVPLFRDAVEAARVHPAGSIGAAFAHAGSAKTRGEARSRWEGFLERYPATSEFEDSAHRRYVEAALYELARVDYLLGRTESGDTRLKQADPLRLGQHRP